MYVCMYVCMYVGCTFRYKVAILASGKITENEVWIGVYRYEMLDLLGALQEPIVNTARTSILWVCDVSSQTLLVASKYSKTSCFRCFSLKKNPKLPHCTWMYHMHICTYTHPYPIGHVVLFFTNQVKAHWNTFEHWCSKRTFCKQRGLS